MEFSNRENSYSINTSIAIQRWKEMNSFFHYIFPFTHLKRSKSGWKKKFLFTALKLKAAGEQFETFLVYQQTTYWLHLFEKFRS